MIRFGMSEFNLVYWMASERDIEMEREEGECMNAFLDEPDN